jgi:hypothetical protein
VWADDQLQFLPPAFFMLRPVLFPTDGLVR